MGEVGLSPGQCVLDYGCGIGGHSVAAAQAIGEQGVVYAADIHPRALQAVRQAAARASISNIRTIETDCATGLEDSSVDAALFYDTFHSLDQCGPVLRELHRVLKPSGVLSFSDHHMSEEQILAAVAQSGLFRLIRKARRSYLFEAVAG
ncbi:MAG: class I SAM-dependent methyltransferase [Chloroflexi bacterium]|nr:class I SAM-dependent methyltransferase [Chloroflexota bacterium]